MKKEYKISFNNIIWNVDLERNCSREFRIYDRDSHEYKTVRINYEILEDKENINGRR